ncbi:hypothetical protein HZU77_007975 [Neisseriaceae bacterium TC5R-5]|nr:hypothetical protein [Neisseriaceae bacterium TC5R-5]
MSTPLDNNLTPLAARQAVHDLNLELGALHRLHQQLLPGQPRLDVHLQRARGYQQAIASTLGENVKILSDTHSALQVMLQCLRKLEDDKLLACEVRVLLEPFERQMDGAV